MSSGLFLTLLIVCPLIDAAVATAVILGRRVPAPAGEGRPPLSVGTLALALLAAGAVFLLKIPLLGLAGFDAFGVIHLAYIDIVIATPVVGLLTLLGGVRWGGKHGTRRLTKATRWLALGSLLLPSIGYYATYVEPFRLQLEREIHAVDGRRAGRSPLTIGVLADLQTSRVTEHERAAVDRLLAEKPDIILVPGDVFQGTPRQLERELAALRDLFARLRAPGGAYLVLGNVDTSLEAIQRIIHDTPVRLLRDELVTVQVGDRRVTVAGLSPRRAPGRDDTTIRRLEETPGEDDIRILMAHFPGVLHELEPRSRIDLMVAGHTHGGQVVIPFLGPPLTLSRAPREIAAGGLHRHRGNAVYVSRGVGLERGQAPRLRFLCPPEITILELVSGDGEADREGPPAE